MPKTHYKGPMQRRLIGRASLVAKRCLSRFLCLVIGRKLLLCAAIAMLGVIAPAQYAAAQKPVIHLALSRNVALHNPSQKEMAAIFLGRKRQWSDGTRVKIAILESTDKQRIFLSAVADRFPNQYWAHWRNIVFSGRGIMPKIFKSEEEILRYLAEEEGVIGQITNTRLADHLGVATLTIKGEGRP